MPWPKGRKRSLETRLKMKQAHQGRILRPVEDRFWEKVDKKGPNSCWIWIGAIRRDDPKNAYGHFHYNGIVQRAHRVAYQILVGPIPKGMSVLHNCPGGDNPSCVNPKHLFLGTQLDNMSDAARKGRMSRVGHKHTEETKEKLRVGMIGKSKPEAQRIKATEAKRAVSKLSHEIVNHMKRMREDSGQSYKSIGEKFGVCAVTAFLAIKGQTWRK